MERDKPNNACNLAFWKFQLTRSRGAWHELDSPDEWDKDFNSHAHVERDLYDSVQPYAEYNFNSHAHVERDDFRFNRHVRFGEHFNSHAHVERD